MKRIISSGFLLLMVMAIAGCAATTPSPDHGAKTIHIDPTLFNSIYPAVWFSPSTGEISPIMKKVNYHAEKRFEIFIEPRDPEFAYLRGREDRDMGFALVGKGPDAFMNPQLPEGLELELRMMKLMDERQAEEQLVFYCQARSSTCLIMITAMDPEKKVIAFKWRLLNGGS